MQRIYVIYRNGTLEEDGYLTDDLLDCVAFIQKQCTPSEAEAQEISIVECVYSDDGAFIKPLSIRYLDDFWSRWRRESKKRGVRNEAITSCLCCCPRYHSFAGRLQCTTCHDVIFGKEVQHMYSFAQPHKRSRAPPLLSGCV